jgi:16S rRNA (cytidine1402-2'-O)-methyltransferase
MTCQNQTPPTIFCLAPANSFTFGLLLLKLYLQKYSLIMDTPSGTLYLIPAPLGPGGEAAIPEYVRSTMHGLDHFLAEKAKTARHFLKSTDLPRPIQEYKVEELNKHTPAELIPDLLQPLLQGKDMGLLSEAGCPGIADPGARAVAVAHDLGIKVVPLVGPSSILLGLMASGLNGQHFIFHGYLSAQTTAIDERTAPIGAAVAP